VGGHAWCYHALPELKSAEQGVWLERLEQEHHNLPVALELAMSVVPVDRWLASPSMSVALRRSTLESSQRHPPS
jgi:hypothetical protein